MDIDTMLTHVIIPGLLLGVVVLLFGALILAIAGGVKEKPFTPEERRYLDKLQKERLLKRLGMKR